MSTAFATASGPEAPAATCMGLLTSRVVKPLEFQKEGVLLLFSSTRKDIEVVGIAAIGAEFCASRIAIPYCSGCIQMSINPRGHRILFARLMTMLGSSRITGRKVYFKNALRPQEWKTRRNDVIAKHLTIAWLRLHPRFGATIEEPEGADTTALYLF